MRTDFKEREPIKGSGSVLVAKATNVYLATNHEIVNKDKKCRS